MVGSVAWCFWWVAWGMTDCGGWSDGLLDVGWSDGFDNGVDGSGLACRPCFLIENLRRRFKYEFLASNPECRGMIRTV